MGISTRSELVRGPAIRRRDTGRAGMLIAAAASVLLSPVAWGQPATISSGAASEAQSGGIEDIVVTARKFTESAQATPVTITALSSEDLVTHQITSTTDLARVSPGIYFMDSPANPGSGVFAGFRAQTNSSTLQTLAPSIASYQNQVYLGSLIGFKDIGLLDVERVEVLKGPQGTLYGRNTTGGAISIYTKQPTDVWEGEVSAGAGNHGLFTGHGVLNVPIVKDKLAMRLVAAASTNDGYARDIISGQNLENQKAQFYRATIRIDPTENLHISLLGEYSKSEFGGLNLVPLRLTPNSTTGYIIAVNSGLLANTTPNRLAYLGGALPATTAAVQTIFDRYKGGIGGDKDLVAYSSPQSERTTTDLFSATVSYDLGWGEIKSITAARDIKDQPTVEFDGLPFVVLENDPARNSLSTTHLWTEEVDLSGRAFNDRLKFSVGGFYLHQKGRDATYVLNFPTLLPGQPNILDGTQTVKNKAVFGQATFALTQKLNITGGVRYTDESKSLFVNNYSGVSCAVPPPATLPPATCVGTFAFSETNISYTAGMDFRPTDGVMIYVKADRGFRAGGINGRTTADPVSVKPFDSEIADSYEIGAKTDLFDRRLRLNVDYYYLRAKNLQQSVLVTGSTGPALSLVQNAGRGIIQGVEGEVSVVPMEGVLLQGNLAYTEPKYRDFINPANGADLSGRDYLLVSKWAYSLSGSYTMPFEFGDVTFQTDWAWKSSQNLFPSGGYPDLDTQPGYGILNAQLSLDLKASDVKLTAWTKNLTDKRVLNNMVDAQPLGILTGAYNWPRTYGVSIRKRF